MFNITYMATTKLHYITQMYKFDFSILRELLIKYDI